MKRIRTYLLFGGLARAIMTMQGAESTPEDSTLYRELEEINIVAVKQRSRLKEEAVSSSVIGQGELERLGVDGMKGASAVIPNFYVPDYGSRITSTMYVRGIGARMDQPAVGLNVDNVPYVNKNTYDFDVSDIAAVEMLRGPQSTLFGRNTMGGLIDITTLSPMLFQGWRFMAEGASGNSWKASAGGYFKPKDHFATSLTLNFGYAGGYFTNIYNGRKLDHELGGGLRWKLQWRPSGRIYLQNVLAGSMLRQGGYPYEYTETGEINYNDTCFYRRATLTDGLSLAYRGGKITINSVTTLQHLDDNMTLDQDFLPKSYFTLTQKQKETSLTEDIVIKGVESDSKYRWLVGVFGFYKHLGMQAPVTFKDTGIAELIESHTNAANPYYPIAWDSREFVLGSDFTIPTYGIAAYHESKLMLGRWELTAGLRLDYESSGLDYHSQCNTGYTIYRNSSGELTPYSHVNVDIDDTGNLRRRYFNWMPRISVLWNFEGRFNGNIYGVISKGYKAGGFNTQMFSEVLQERLMNIMGIGSKHDINEIVGYKPEYSWNYEAGAHIGALGGKLDIDLSAFYIDCHDQQLTTFPAGTTTGRIMTNAGKTRSFGGEVSMTGRPVNALTLNASYGYTNAKFVKYNDGRQDYKGKYIPYAPGNTLFIQALYQIGFKKSVIGIDRMLIDLNVKGTGQIYWDEANDYRQPFYAEAGASVTFEGRKWSVRIWGENLTDTKFHTFYFKSMGNSFVQRGKPLRGGVTLRVNI